VVACQSAVIGNDLHWNHGSCSLFGGLKRAKVAGIAKFEPITDFLDASPGLAPLLELIQHRYPCLP
jgi:hypothetical protein